MRIGETQLHMVNVDPLAVDEVARPATVTNEHIIAQPHLVAARFVVDQFCATEWTILAVQMRVCEVADILDDKRMVRLPREVERHARPSLCALQFWQFGHRHRLGPSRIAGKDPDQPIACAHRKRGDADPRHLPPEQLMRDRYEVARAVVGPAMIGTGKVAAVDLAERQFDVAMRAAVLEGMHDAIAAAKENNRPSPSHRLRAVSFRTGCNGRQL